jgi:hypothetical protein
MQVARGSRSGSVIQDGRSICKPHGGVDEAGAPIGTLAVFERRQRRRVGVRSRRQRMALKRRSKST